MAQKAWQSIEHVPDSERHNEAQRLLKITHRLTGFLDETLVFARPRFSLEAVMHFALLRWTDDRSRAVSQRCE